MDFSSEKTIQITTYKCSHCGYETNHSSHSARHKKTLKCENPNMTKEVPVMKIEDVKELMKSKSVDDYLELTTIVATKTDENDKLNKIIQQQRKTLLKISETYEPESDDEDNEDGVGIHLLYVPFP